MDFFVCFNSKISPHGDIQGDASDNVVSLWEGTSLWKAIQSSHPLSQLFGTVLFSIFSL